MTASNFKILIVDDEDDLREIISELFKIFNYQVETACSGDEAWNRLQESEYDIVISDIRMPGGTGPELLKKIKDRDIYKPRVFFISGFYDFSLEEIFELGADGLFAKPFDSTQLRNSVQKVLKGLNELWCDSQIYENKCEIYKKFKSIPIAIEASDLRFGRGGFYIKDTEVSCNVGDIIGFKFDFEDEFIDSFEGKGRILWRRDKECKLGGPGMGIEIFSLEKHCLDKYINWLLKQNFRSYIPKG